MAESKIFMYDYSLFTLPQLRQARSEMVTSVLFFAALGAALVAVGITSLAVSANRMVAAQQMDDINTGNAFFGITAGSMGAGGLILAKACFQEARIITKELCSCRR